MKELNTRDLRIGNLVVFESETCKITTIGKRKVGVSRRTENGNFVETLTEISEIEPIPITEEWLLKLGFKEQNTEIGSRFRKKNFYITKNTDFDFYLKDVKSGIYIHFMKLDFFHELQNIWYCLNGKDLKINDNLDNL